MTPGPGLGNPSPWEPSGKPRARMGVEQGDGGVLLRWFLAVTS